MTNAPPTQSFISQFTRFRNDPWGFVCYSYPWTKEGTFLSDETGPDTWQVDVMEDIRHALEERDMSSADEWAAIQLAVASGHGIGKTALVAWLVHWFICTRPNPQIVVTAGTAAQLEKKTWRELSKWHQVSLQKEWFTWTATKFYLTEQPDTWFASALPWSEHNSDAFAGTHEKYVLYLFDEASTIADIIWEVSEGAMTTDQCIWIAFGNPVRNTGRFKACFGKFKRWWITRKVDSRCARKANKAQIQQWLEQYGEDSDFFRKRVRGEFPTQASNQLISEKTADECRAYRNSDFHSFPIRIGCDVARFGEDDTVISVVQGRRVHEMVAMHHKDTVQVYTKLVDAYNHWRKKHDNICIYVDDIGVGGGVTDMCKAGGLPVIGVNSGARADDPETFLNKRIEMWWNMAEAMKNHLDMTDVPREMWDRFKDDVTNIEYFQQPTTQKYQLESVKDIKEKKDLPSPDYGTSVALAFAYPVPVGVQSGQSKFAKANSSTTTMQRKRKANGVR